MSAELWLALARFGAACAGSVLVAALLDLALRQAGARWHTLRAHRSVWLLAQAAVVLGLVLALLPVPRSVIAPTLLHVVPAAGIAADPVKAEAPTVSLVDTGADDEPHQSAQAAQALAALALHCLPAGWLAVYLTGLLVLMARRWQAAMRWRALLREHTHLIDAAALQACSAMTPGQRARIGAATLSVRTTALPVSPLLHGVRRPCLLLPAHLATLDVGQQQLIVEHELTHWRRADPLWLALSGALTLVFWFNRPLRRLGESLRDAVELGCDDAVLAGRPATERRSYAAALVAQLRLQAPSQDAAGPAWGAAFGASATGMTERVQRMRTPSPARLSVPGRLLVGAAVAGVALFGAALQPAFSSAPAPLSDHGAEAWVQAPHVHQTWRYPLMQPRVTSLYGVRSPSVPKGHHGIDLAARRGTPVHAVAAGTVSEAAFDDAWGHYVRVDHGGGRSSLLIHLARIDVAPGQRVVAGDALGTSGASGKATGPHLHLEYWQDGRRLDPGQLLPDLLEHATANALKRRAAQNNPLPTDL